MKTLVVLVVLAAVGFYFYKNGIPGTGPKVTVAADQRSLTLATQQGGTATFSIGEGFDGTYMLFGASEGCRDSRGACGSLSVLPIGVATTIARRYADFHRCASPGAREGKANTYNLQLLVPDRKTQQVLKETAADYDRRMRESGNRLCVTLSGNYVDFVQAEMGGATLTAAQVPQPPAGALKQYFVLPKAVSAHECPPLT
jgi:hypothetical protein